MTDVEIEQAINDIVILIFDNFAVSNLYGYMSRSDNFSNLDNYEIESIWGMRDLINMHTQNQKLIDKIARSCLSQFKYFVFKNNQYVYFDQETESRIKSEYIDFLEFVYDCLNASSFLDSFKDNFSVALENHYNQMIRILEECSTVDEPEYLTKYLLRPAISEDYSAEFQLNLFDIEPGRLMQPVLDLGCGMKGELVKYLDGLGIQVLGIDRLAPAGESFVADDWFRFDFRPSFWGTIIAHQSLSPHFIFNHSTSERMARDYAYLIMKILDSLKVNGKFYYAPGLPFFEEHLSSLPSLKLERLPINLTVDLDSIYEIAYAVAVTRLR